MRRFPSRHPRVAGSAWHRNCSGASTPSSAETGRDFSLVGADPDPVPGPAAAAARKPTQPSFEVDEDMWSRYPFATPSGPREAWIEDLSSSAGDDSSNQLIRLHPDVWAVRPRIDIMFANVRWQAKYKRVEYDYQKDRYEMSFTRGGRPWPQKGTGRARHATTTSPIWIQGGKAHGTKGPVSHYTMLDYNVRVAGLVHTLSAKFAQDDVRFVRSLDIPTRDPRFVEDLIDERGWGLSTLFVDTADEFPASLTAATTTLFHVNMMPAYGLNVHDMLKHKTLVMTVRAVRHVEDRLLFATRRLDSAEKMRSSRTESTYDMADHHLVDNNIK